MNREYVGCETDKEVDKRIRSVMQTKPTTAAVFKTEIQVCSR